MDFHISKYANLANLKLHVNEQNRVVGTHAAQSETIRDVFGLTLYQI